MRAEVLYVLGCPFVAPAVAMLEEALAAEGVAALVELVIVGDERRARELRFRGSPTLRIEGRDVDDLTEGWPELPSYAVSCRLYPGSPRAGVPPAEAVRRAVREAREKARAER